VAIAHSGLPAANGTGTPPAGAIYLARLALAATGRDVAPRVTPDEIVQGAD